MGFPKTGSSALQVCLAQNRRALADNNIIYPVNHNDEAVEGRISSGNGRMVSYFFKKPCWKPKRIAFEKKVSSWLKGLPNDGSLVFSSETMYCDYTLSRLRKLQRLCEEHGAILECMLYVRSLVGYSYSMHNQMVKRGYDKDFSFFVRNDLRVPFDALCVIRDHGFQLEARNYDELENGVEHDFLYNYMGLTSDKIQVETKVINRSLSEEELELMITFNKIEKLKQLATVISNSLVYRHSEAKEEKSIRKEDLDYLQMEYGHLVKSLNNAFPNIGLSVSDPKIKIKQP